MNQYQKQYINIFNISSHHE